MNSERRWNKAGLIPSLALAVTLLLAGCGANDGKANGAAGSSASAANSGAETQTQERATQAVTGTETEIPSSSDSETEAGTLPEAGTETETEEHEMTLQMTIGGTAVNVKWEENESAKALKALCKDGPLTIQMSGYGGFEQVGRIGRSLPRADVQTTTEAGDIVLYSGNQLVIFYGSNSWAYTRLGHVELSAAEMAALLGSGDVSLTLSLE